MPPSRLINANRAPRCQHVKVNGDRCGSPARRGRPYCCFHDSPARRNRDFVLPIVEDAASLQLALNRILQALLDQLIDRRTATTLLYGLQIGFANLKQLKSEQYHDELERRFPTDDDAGEELEDDQAAADAAQEVPAASSPDDLIPDIQACADGAHERIFLPGKKPPANRGPDQQERSRETYRRSSSVM